MSAARRNRQVRDTRTAAAIGAQLLDGLPATLDRRSLMEFLQELKLCKERGRRQLAFFEARTYGSNKNCS
jgi:hypothetical protein